MPGMVGKPIAAGEIYKKPKKDKDLPSSSVESVKMTKKGKTLGPFNNKEPEVDENGNIIQRVKDFKHFDRAGQKVEYKSLLKKRTR